MLDKSKFQNASTFYQTLFDEVFSKGSQAYLKYANEHKVTGTQYQFRFSTNFPQLAKLVGPKSWMALRANSHTIAIEPYCAPLVVDGVDFEGDKDGVARSLTQFLKGASLNKAVLTKLVRGNSGGSGDLCYDGVSMFNAAHPYGPDGSTQANRSTNSLTEANYEAARQAMMALKDEGGNALGIRPKILLCSPTLETTARKILQRQITIEVGGTDAGAGVSNIHSSDGVEIVVDAGLEATIDGADATYYWFLIDPDFMPIDVPVLTAPAPKDDLDQLNTINDQIHFEVLGRLGIGYGLWQAAYGNFATS